MTATRTQLRNPLLDAYSLYMEKGEPFGWEPYTSSMATRCLRAFRGDTFIYVGEGKGGCCATDGFFAELERNWVSEQEISIPQWQGIRDWAFIFRRKESS